MNGSSQWLWADPVSQFLSDGDEPHDGRRHLCLGAGTVDLLLFATAFYPRNRAVWKQGIAPAGWAPILAVNGPCAELRQKLPIKQFSAIPAKC